VAIIDASSPDVEEGITRIDGYQYGLTLNRDGERFVDGALKAAFDILKNGAGTPVSDL
jgi:uncharacterized protein YggE